MDFKKIKLVLGREFSIRVKKKSFIITTIVTPILFAALMIVPSLIMMADWDKDINRVMVLDDSGVVAQALESGGGDRVCDSGEHRPGVCQESSGQPGRICRDVCLASGHSQQCDCGRLRRQAINAKVSDATKGRCQRCHRALQAPAVQYREFRPDTGGPQSRGGPEHLHSR